ncbi:MAG: hypothetical protein U9M97_00295 [Candidatus Hadarchaeota archaeon]|nr:hypothetical protein [Candidatus Hadarchaeota archaeon]
MTLAGTTIYAVGFLVAVLCVAPVVEGILGLFGPRPRGVGEIRGAGRAIGILERALITPLIFVGAYEAVGLALAAKSIARFDQLRDKRFAEHYLIGTLASMSLAVVVGLITSVAVKILG